ncbi:VirC2 family conjugal transfer protein [Rhizobium leguminosarum]|uniref:VirC2 family conjugal transfer protein n=1 Tax=Rhizobium leguminosarum TaxID=384 RepID=UPI001C94FE25|nr:VirC2 family conjugal transfer protein [Rhizobium leguminosarum]MBY5775231.1 VirC2 family conjugal transfer protein [Rhizobium leguminosarum]
MGIRKPILSVKQARKLASVRSKASEDMAGEPHEPDVAATGVVTASSNAGVVGHRVGRDNGAARRPKEPAVKPATDERGSSDKDISTYSSVSVSVARRDKVQVFLSAPLPAAGVSPTFELLCKHYNPQKALQMILRKALRKYEFLLANGDFQFVTQTYVVDEALVRDVVQTSRMMPNQLVAIARAHFDPLGLESTRAFGRKLATAALAAFFLRE